jgi:hypothetical protein
MSDTPSHTTEPDSTQPAHRPPGRADRQRKFRPAAAVIGTLILLGVGAGAGIAIGRLAIPGYKHQVAQIRGELRVEQGKLTAEQGQVQAAQTQAQNARTAAQNALATATTTVKAQYAAKFAALRQQENTLAAKEHQVNVELGRIARNTISADGVYVVGHDIASGTWHTSGGSQCYFATLGSTDTSNIMDNNNFNGPETVNVSGAYAFQISGGCTWVLQ